uniref:Protein FRA10AC1 homolog n=1 Tax=Caenorhabditis japonica TaxID=281687 RepID=A0A8R1DMF8_CAEJA
MLLFLASVLRRNALGSDEQTPVAGIMGSRNIRNPYHGIDDLQSDFGDEDFELKNKRKRNDFMEKVDPGKGSKKKRSEGRAEFEEEHGKMHRRMSKMMSMNAYDRHKEIINLYYLSYPGATQLLNRTVQDEKTDFDVLNEHHKFVWNEEDQPDSWEKRMAKKYYEKLFKEYCIVDLSMYKSNKIGMRWRTETEVKDGKGQLMCGTRKCQETASLASWEVNFSYKENGRPKSTLVKARLCQKCSEKLNYGSQKRQVKQKKRAVRRWEKERKRESADEQKDDETLEEKSETVKEKDQATTSTLSASTDIWEGSAPAETEKTVDDEIDEFLDDLFL